MSLSECLQAALVSALRDNQAVGGVVTGVFDAPPVRARPPFVTVAETMFSDWGAKAVAGREGRVAVLAEDAGERPVRVRAICDAIAETLAAMPRDLGEGWRIVTVVQIRSRIVTAGERRWTGMVEARIRMLRSG